MLTLPDFREKQILFIQAERGAENKIKFWNDNFRFVKDGQNINQVSCHRLFAVYIIGEISLTSIVLQRAKEYGISIFLLDNRLNQYASIGSQTEGHYLLRQKQYVFNDELGFAKQLVRNKIINQAALLKETKTQAVFPLNELLARIENAKDNQTLLGIEGNSSKHFFEIYFEPIGWSRRLPRAKTDIPNLLLDIGYHYLFNFIDSLLRLYGFDTYKGIYHKLFFQRRSLACDIMEPFRCLIDRQIRKSYNLNQVNEKDFYVKNGQYCLRYDKNAKYGKIFTQTLVDNREEVYNYIRAFYRCVLDSANDYPIFKLKKG